MFDGGEKRRYSMKEQRAAALARVVDRSPDMI